MPYGLINQGYRCSDFFEDGTDVQTNVIFVCDLPPYTTEEAIRGHFRKYGRIMDCTLVNKGRQPGFGFVHFDNKTAAHQVVADGGMQALRGKWFEVRKALPMSQVPASQSGGSSGGTVPFGGAPQGGRARSPDGGSRSFREEFLRAREAAGGGNGKARKRKSSSSSSSSSSHKKRKKKKTRKKSSSSSSSDAKANPDDKDKEEVPGTNPEVEKAKSEALQKLVKLKELDNKEARMKEWRALLREWHPDKNPDRADIATPVFQFLQKSRPLLESG
jgi:RNA recognition motif-containing protein